MSLYLEDPSQKKGNFSDTLMMSLLFFGVFYLIFMFTTKEQPKKIEAPEVKVSQAPALLTNANKKDKVIKNQDITLDTERFHLVFSSESATIKQIQLKDFKNGNNELFNLTPNLQYPQTLPLIYKLAGYSFTNGFEFTKDTNTLTFTQTQNGLTLVKQYIFSPQDFSIKLHISLINKTNTQIVTDAFIGWGEGLGPFVPKEDSVQYDTIVTQAYYNSLLSNEKTITGGSISEVAPAQWIAMDNRYFLVAIMPEQNGESLVNLNSRSSQDPMSQFIELGNRLTVDAGKTLDQNFTVFIGPKKKELLEPFHKNLERVTERGWFFFPLLGSFLIWIVTLIKGLVGSYGLAIIIFALLLRIIFHPLNIQSMIATARQGELQVKIKAIKEKYPDKQTQNMKVMELYKTEQISFLKGCLPLIIQIPFFITFYQQLPHLIDLAQSHFLWIKDLSSPDTVYHIQAFKYLPVLPYRINLLPIIITIATLFQMILTSKNQASNPQAKIMMYTMPIIFLFILWNAPAALNLYWLTQTLGTMGTQALFNKNKVRILEQDKAKRKSKKATKTKGK